MEYTVQQLSVLAGVSPRTIRYYDEIGLLKPARISPAGYRIYRLREVDRLQQILFYRELGVSLACIKEILTKPDFDEVAALREHRRQLLAKRQRLDLLIANVEKTLAAKEGRIVMADKEKFEGFKRRLVEENEAKYGREARDKYGDATVDASNAKVLGMTQEQYQRLMQLELEFKETLAAAFQAGDPAGEQAQKAADLHRQWLCFFWDNYSKEAHAGLVQMYVDDERFRAYYDEKQPGTAAFLRDAVLIYTGMNQ
ncbi:MAG TPA: MerR family transcriptional regulator [Clostridia bacterium]|nr:MerR family transcriptional regulator [Clostridia bacterium]